jgi:hypothetical protein
MLARSKPSESDQALQSTDMVQMKMADERCVHLQRVISRSREPFQGTIAAVYKPWLAIHDEKIGGLRSLGA